MPSRGVVFLWLCDDIAHTIYGLPGTHHPFFKLLCACVSTGTVQDNEDAYIRTKFWTSALNSGADIGIIALGTNDAKDEYWQGSEPFASAYRNIIETALATFNVVCLSVPIPQLSEFSHWSNRTTINKALPPAVYALAREYSLPLVDARSYYYLHDANASHPILNASLYEDPIHPNAIGYRYIAEATKDIIDRIIIAEPSALPMPHPVSLAPTRIPTTLWTALPSMAPMPMPHAAPTMTPEAAPTAMPSTAPTSHPLAAPTALPIHAPTQLPETMAPVGLPSSLPLSNPTGLPSPAPSDMPTDAPQSTPTAVPVVLPTLMPVAAPTANPTHFPTTVPEIAPTAIPLHLPTTLPTPMPFHALTAIPPAAPTAMPHHAPIPNPDAPSTAMPVPEATAPPPQAEQTMMPVASPTGTSRLDATSTGSNRRASRSTVSLEVLVFVALGGAVVALLVGGAYWYFAHCYYALHQRATPSRNSKSWRDVKKVGPVGQDSPTSRSSVSPAASCASKNSPFFNCTKPIALSAPNLRHDSRVLQLPASILRDAKSLSIPRRTIRNYAASAGLDFKRGVPRASFRSTTSLSLDSEGSIVRVDGFHTPRSSNFVISNSSPMHSANDPRRAPPVL